MNALLLAAVLATSATGPVEFQRHELAAFPAGYQAIVADVNADRKPDVIAVSTDKSLVNWFENPTWKEHPVSTADRGVDIAARDIDGDGRPEIALAAGFYFGDSARGGQILYLAPPAPSGDLWQEHLIATDPVTHRVVWADVDGDKRPELIHAPIFGPGSKANIDTKPVHFEAFRLPDDLKAGPWTPQMIDGSLTVLHGVYAGDLDGDGRDEILTASYEGINRYDFEGSGGEGKWKKMAIGNGADPVDASRGAARGSSEVTWGHLARGAARPFIGAVEPWHGDLVVVYTPAEPNAPWQRRVLDDTIRTGHGAAAADLDGDGRDELVIGWRGGTGGLAIYDPLDDKGGQWSKIVLDSGPKIEDVAIADLNGDGRLDIIAVDKPANRIWWYENRPPRNK
jgi:hypothetical protein